jgi:hypothetical protein
VRSAKAAGATSTVDPTRRPSGTARTSPPSSPPAAPQLGSGAARKQGDDPDGDVVAEL